MLVRFVELKYLLTSPPRRNVGTLDRWTYINLVEEEELTFVDLDFWSWMGVPFIRLSCFVYVKVSTHRRKVYTRMWS